MRRGARFVEAAEDRSCLENDACAARFLRSNCISVTHSNTSQTDRVLKSHRPNECFPHPGIRKDRETLNSSHTHTPVPWWLGLHAPQEDEQPDQQRTSCRQHQHRREMPSFWLLCSRPVCAVDLALCSQEGVCEERYIVFFVCGKKSNSFVILWGSAGGDRKMVHAITVYHTRTAYHPRISRSRLIGLMYTYVTRATTTYILEDPRPLKTSHNILEWMTKFAKNNPS